MNRWLPTFKAFLFFVPYYHYFWWFGVFSLFCNALITTFAREEWMLLNGFFNIVGLGLTSIIPLFALGGVLRVWLSNKQTQLLPQFRERTLLVFVLTITLAWSISYFFTILEFQIFKSIRNDILAPTLLIFTLIPWSVFWVSQFQWGPLLLWLAVLLNNQWLGSLYRAVITYANDHSSITLFSVIAIWSLGISYCLNKPRIAPARSWQHQIKASDTPHSFNFSFFTRRPKIRSPEGALFYDGNDTLLAKCGRIALLMYVFPSIFLLLTLFLDRGDRRPLYESFGQTFAFMILWGFMMTTGIMSVTISKLRLLWLRSTQSRGTLLNTLTQLIYTETALLMIFILPIFIYAGFVKAESPSLLISVFFAIAGLHWFTATTISYFTLTNGGSWKTGFTLIMGVAFLCLSFFLSKLAGPSMGLFIAALTTAGAFQLQRKLRGDTCYIIDLNVVRPMKLNQTNAKLF